MKINQSMPRATYQTSFGSKEKVLKGLIEKIETKLPSVYEKEAKDLGSLSGYISLPITNEADRYNRAVARLANSNSSKESIDNNEKIVKGFFNKLFSSKNKKG